MGGTEEWAEAGFRERYAELCEEQLGTSGEKQVCSANLKCVPPPSLSLLALVSFLVNYLKVEN